MPCYQRLTWYYLGNRVRWWAATLRIHTHPVADLYLLKLGKYAVGIYHFTAYNVLEQFIAVETAAPLAQLNQPRPDAFSRRVNSDSTRCLVLGHRHQLVAREHPAHFSVG